MQEVITLDELGEEAVRINPALTQNKPVTEQEKVQEREQQYAEMIVEILKRIARLAKLDFANVTKENGSHPPNYTTEVGPSVARLVPLGFRDRPNAARAHGQTGHRPAGNRAWRGWG